MAVNSGISFGAGKRLARIAAAGGMEHCPPFASHDFGRNT